MFFQKRVLRSWSKLTCNGDFTGVRKASTNRFQNDNFRQTISTKISAERQADPEQFLAAFHGVVSSEVGRACKFANTGLIAPWLKELMEYNSYGGNRPRGLMTVSAYQMLEEPGNITEEKLGKARLLGWCVEMLQTAILISDDMLDNSSTRRGAECWYRLPHVGLRAVNDSLVFLFLLHSTLQHNFGPHPHYAQLLDAFNEGVYSMTIGQHLDYEALKKFELFTMDHWKLIQTTKMTNYTFKVPAFCGLMLANRTLDDPYKNTHDIFTDMGALIMMQNDYKDCFGDQSVVGKEGTDIQEGKCSWLAVTALQRFSTSQREQFETCYGSADEQRVRRVKELYLDVDVPALYRDALRTTYNDIVARINQLPPDDVITAPVMRMLVDTMYHLHSANA